MKKEWKTNLKAYIFWTIVVLLIVGSYLVIKPYLIPLISAFILAYLVQPIFKFLTSKANLNKVAAGIICVLLIVLIILIPLTLIVGGVTQQAYSLLTDGSVRAAIQSLADYSFIENLPFDLETIRTQVLSFFITLLKGAASHIPSVALAVLIIIVGSYYLLINWDLLSDKLQEYIPFSDKQQIVKEIGKTTKILLYGTLVIALIEAIVASLGFGLLGVDSYLLLAALIFFFAFIPSVGPIFIWAPVALYYIATLNYFTALGVIILGIILSFGIDNLLRTKMLGEKAKIHPLIMLVGILGGISVFGIFGFIIGPLILIYTIKLIEEAMHASD